MSHLKWGLSPFGLLETPRLARVRAPLPSLLNRSPAPSPPSAGCSLARRARWRTNGSTRPPLSPLPPPLRFAGRASPPLRRDRRRMGQVEGGASRWGLAAASSAGFQGLAGRGVRILSFSPCGRRWARRARMRGFATVAPGLSSTRGETPHPPASGCHLLPQGEKDDGGRAFRLG